MSNKDNKTEIEKIIETLQTRGWETPEEVDEFFKKSLEQIATKAREEERRECLEISKETWEIGRRKGIEECAAVIKKMKDRSGFGIPRNKLINEIGQALKSLNNK